MPECATCENPAYCKGLCQRHYNAQAYERSRQRNRQCKCGAIFTPAPYERVCASCRDARQSNGGGRRPDTPCAGCGKLLWSSRTSLPAGERMCRLCRRANPQVSPKPYTYVRKPERTVTCQRCGGSFTTTFSAKKFCSTMCQQRTRDSKRMEQIGRTRGGRPYRRLREQVLAEESKCWLCNKPIGTRPFPDPLSGTIDHVVPVSVDPSRMLDRSNVRAAHFRCNSKRTDFQFGKEMLRDRAAS